MIAFSTLKVGGDIILLEGGGEMRMLEAEEGWIRSGIIVMSRE